ncbi:cyclic AMP receptor 1-like isoform X2 [Watersipora subatra]|uniref:cyclic AMP receptor 1-like isoform X2 n=1 Tax=Watersipora subatra TaxID=2589382 RepID=UPI00355C56CD
MNTTNEVELLDCDLPIGECEIARKVKVGLCSLSVVVLLLAFSCILLLRRFRLSHELSGRPEDSGAPSCRAQGFFIQLFSFAELTWICNLTTFVYFIMIKEKNTSKHEKLYTLLGWILPAIVACVPLFTDDYNLSSAPYCWISSSTTGHIFRILLYWAPAIILDVGMVITFSYVIWKIRKRSDRNRNLTETNSQQLKEYFIPLAGYAAAYLLLSLSLFITRLTQISLKTTFGNVMLVSILNSLWGTVVSCLVLLTSNRSNFTKMQFASGLKYYKTLLKKIIKCDASSGSGPDEVYVPGTPLDSPASTLPRNQNNDD